MVRTNAQVSLGKIIRDLREKKAWTQEEFADRVGLHRTYIGSIERGERNISLENILAVSDALKIKPSELLAHASL